MASFTDDNAVGLNPADKIVRFHEVAGSSESKRIEEDPVRGPTPVTATASSTDDSNIVSIKSSHNDSITEHGNSVETGNSVDNKDIADANHPTEHGNSSETGNSTDPTSKKPAATRKPKVKTTHAPIAGIDPIDAPARSTRSKMKIDDPKFTSSGVPRIPMNLNPEFHMNTPKQKGWSQQRFESNARAKALHEGDAWSTGFGSHRVLEQHALEIDGKPDLTPQQIEDDFAAMGIPSTKLATQPEPVRRSRKKAATSDDSSKSNVSDPPSPQATRKSGRAKVATAKAAAGNFGAAAAVSDDSASSNKTELPAVTKKHQTISSPVAAEESTPDKPKRVASTKRTRSTVDDTSLEDSRPAKIPRVSPVDSIEGPIIHGSNTYSRDQKRSIIDHAALKLDPINNPFAVIPSIEDPLTSTASLKRKREPVNDDPFDLAPSKFLKYSPPVLSTGSPEAVDVKLEASEGPAHEITSTFQSSAPLAAQTAKPKLNVSRQTRHTRRQALPLEATPEADNIDAHTAGTTTNPVESNSIIKGNGETKVTDSAATAAANVAPTSDRVLRNKRKRSFTPDVAELELPTKIAKTKSTISKSPKTKPFAPFRYTRARTILGNSAASAAAPADTVPAISRSASPTPQPIKVNLTKTGKQKKDPQAVISRDFTGTSSAQGTSVERPDNADLDQPWQCANPDCSSGMTWYSRDKAQAGSTGGPMGRKVISQYFGRNKGPTKLIPNDVWHYFCRKDYQRTKYSVDKAGAKEACNWSIRVIRDQLFRLQQWRPQALFKVQLAKAAHDRYHHYLELLRANNDDNDAAVAAMPPPKNAAKPTPEDSFPLTLLEHFQTHFVQDSVDFAGLDTLLAWLQQQVDSDATAVMAPMEFLINGGQAGEVVNDPVDNYDAWLTHRVSRLAAVAAAPQSLPHPAAADVQPAGEASTAVDETESDDESEREMSEETRLDIEAAKAIMMLGSGR